MQKMIILLSVLSLLSLSISPKNSYAEVTCKDVIDACDKTLAEKNKALELSDLAIKDCIKNGAYLKADNDQLREDSSKFYHNPFIMAILGFAAGSLTFVYVNRK